MVVTVPVTIAVACCVRSVSDTGTMTVAVVVLGYRNSAIIMATPNRQLYATMKVFAKADFSFPQEEQK